MPQTGIEGGALMHMEMRELVDSARHGDREAFEARVRAGSGRLYAIAYRILRDADLANDALQEALVRIWDDLPTLRDPDRYDPWTYRITCRACYRVAKRERRAALTTLVDARVSESSAFESEIADHDEMERGFRRLSPEHRAVLVLHYYIGLTIGEVAEALHIAPGTVGSRLHYAMRSLRASLESEARITGAMERSR
jgi:RNA polymerase sigma factor (sigma-70 family)